MNHALHTDTLEETIETKLITNEDVTLSNLSQAKSFINQAKAEGRNPEIPAHESTR